MYYVTTNKTTLTLLPILWPMFLSDDVSHRRGPIWLRWWRWRWLPLNCSDLGQTGLACLSGGDWDVTSHLVSLLTTTALLRTRSEHIYTSASSSTSATSYLHKDLVFLSCQSVPLITDTQY